VSARLAEFTASPPDHQTPRRIVNSQPAPPLLAGARDPESAQRYVESYQRRQTANPARYPLRTPAEILDADQLRRGGWDAAGEARREAARTAKKAAPTRWQTRRSTNGNTSSPTPPSSPPEARPDKDSDTERQRAQRAKAYRLRRENRSLVGDIHDTLACCGLGVMGNPDGSPGTSKFACTHETGAVRQTGVMTCHSPFACPVCAPKVAARRAAALGPQFAELVALGHTVSMLTLTVRHDRMTSLAKGLAALSRAWGRVTSGKWWDALRKVGAVGYVRGYDVTRSERNGWHPHLHVSLVLGPEHDDAEVCEALLARWRMALASQGFTTTREAQHYHRADDPEKAARYAVSPAAVYETLAMAMKRARGKGAGLTPFEILDLAVSSRDADDVKAAAKWTALWREYVAATKGKRQVVTSQCLSLDPPDEEEGGPEEDVVLSVSPEGVREMDKGNLVPAVLSAMEDHVGDPEGMRRAVSEVMQPVKSWWAISEWGPPVERFRRTPDDLDRRAMAMPDPPPLWPHVERRRQSDLDDGAASRPAT
jgi:hypothetical protein